MSKPLNYVNVYALAGDNLYRIDQINQLVEAEFNIYNNV